VNDAFERITGYSAADAIGRNCGFLWGDDNAQPAIGRLRVAARQGEPMRLSLRLYRKDGTLFLCGAHILPVKDDTGTVTYFVAALYDLSARARYLKELEFRANRDAMTGLPNRCLLHERLTQAIAYANSYGDPLWVIAIGFDCVATAGETQEPEDCKLLWTTLARRLQSAVAITDTVARLDGGTFVLLLAARRADNLAPQVWPRLLQLIWQPLTVGDREFLPGSRIGVAIYPKNGEDSDSLIANACSAMHGASDAGSDQVRFYSAHQEAVPAK
jgi:PAS domain S-box-containing protein/diguanylate cyclase (GGDEF)-like protein